MQGFDYADLGGGLNVDGAKHQIPQKQMPQLKNWYPCGTKLRRRGGVRKLTTAGAWDQNITGMFPLKLNDGTWVLLVSGQDKFGKMASETVADLSMAAGLVPSVNDKPPVFFQFKDYAYWLRPGNTGLVRLTETAAARAGITPPAAACTIAQGAAGDLVTGNYISVFTYYNIQTALESNPSPVSNTLSLAASKKIDYTGISVSSDSFVTARRIYRTLENQVGVYFFVTQINDNITTTLTEDVTVLNLGRTVSFNNGIPPNTLTKGVIWQERLFATDDVDIFYSELLLAECFGDESIISVFPDDGHKIRGLIAFGDRLVIGKTNKMHYLTGNSQANFGLQTLSDRHGCMSHHSMQVAEGQLFWYGNGKSILKSDGSSVAEISSNRIKAILEDIPDDREEYIVAGVFETLNWYFLSVPQASEGTDNNRKVLVYNYKTDAWTVFEHPSDAPQFIGDFFNENYGHILYSTFYDGHIYQYGDETYGTDFGSPIEAVVATKQDDFGAPGYRKFFDEVWLLMPQVVGGTPLRLEVLRDGLSTAVRDRTVAMEVSDNDSRWKVFKLGTARTPGSSLQFRLTYTGEPTVDLEAMHFEVGSLSRMPTRPR